MVSQTRVTQTVVTVLMDQSHIFAVFTDQGDIVLRLRPGSLIYILWWQELNLEGVTPTVVYTTLDNAL